MEYYKQFNVVMNALDNRGEVASIHVSWSGLGVIYFATWWEGGLSLALAVFVSYLDYWLVSIISLHWSKWSFIYHRVTQATTISSST